jgi:hypothetical protein
MDIKLFREELQASARRKGTQILNLPKFTCFTSTKVQRLTLTRLPGGSNPRIYLSPDDDKLLGLYGGTGADGAQFTCFTSTASKAGTQSLLVFNLPALLVQKHK